MNLNLWSLSGTFGKREDRSNTDLLGLLQPVNAIPVFGQGK